MENLRNVFCALVTGNMEDLNRVTLREEFSKFGNITKIFVEFNKAYAKVYLDELGNLKQACDQLNGTLSWEIKLIQDKRRDENILPYNLSALKHNNNFNKGSQSITRTDNLNEMEEDCVLAGDYVDVHGRPVEVLQAENGQLFVNLDDVRTAGFSIYKKESYENASISKEVDLINFENFLLNQGRKYVLDLKKTFNEDEMLGVFERVKKKMQNKPTTEIGEGRIINSSPNSKNFTIVKNVTSPSTSFIPQTSRSPKQLAENFRPSFSHVQAKPKRDFNYGDNQDNRRHGSSASNGFNRSPNNYESRNDKNQDTNRPTEMRKPKFRNEGNKVIPSKVLANSNVNQEPEESWEGKKSFVARSKLQLDSAPQRNNERNLLNIKRIELPPNAFYKLKVSYIKPDKNNLFYAQWVENLNQIEQILLHVNTIDNELPIIQEPTRNVMCVAKFEDCWYRAVVLKETYNNVCVELIDYGNRENIKEPLREISEEMKNIPGMGIRVAVHGANETAANVNLKTEQYLEVFVKKHISDKYDDMTHLVEIKGILDEPKLEEESLTPPSEISSDQEIQRQNDKPEKKEDCFMEVPPSTGRLSDGEYVMVVGYTNKKYILRNKESALNCKKIYSHLIDIEKKPITNPIVGQLVLCSRDGMEGLHRAVIKQINKEVANLEYLDYNEEVTLSLRSLRNVDKLLASFPSAKIESPEVKYLQGITEKTEEFLSELIINKTKLKVVLNNSNFDLQLVENDNTILLSKKIEQLENPVKTEPIKQEVEQVKETPVVQTIQKKQEDSSNNVAVPSTSQSSPLNDEYVTIVYDEMDFAKTVKGEGKYICYCCKGDSVTLLSTSDAEKYIPELQIEEPSDTNPFEPELFQMCLSKFEGIWYRAIVIDTDEKMYQVLFVDFGNEEKVPKTDIKRFPKKLSTIPILGIPAYFLGIPDDPKVHNRIKQLIPDEEELTVNLKTDLNEDNLKYGVEIPSVYAVLKDENLI